MKKNFILSLSALILAGSLFAQNTPVRLTKEQAKKLYVNLPVKPTENTSSSVNVLRSSIVPSSAIGQTYYDMQTNGSLPQRIVTFADGTTAATWTTADGSASSRGAGYNYFDGTSWSLSANHTDRIESSRGGWPSIASLGNGEIVVSHNGTTGLLVNVRPQKGTGDWTETLLLGPNATNTSTGASSTCLLWPSIATSGNTIHLIACTESDAGYLYQGIQTCLVYIRGTYDASSNTISWESPRVVGDMANHTDWMNSFSGDSYKITANGNYVVVVVADRFSDAFMWKSTDNGTTFTTTNIVNSVVPDNYDFSNPEHYLDTAGGPIYVTDGATAVAIANDGKVHIAFGLTGVNENDTPGDGYFSGYPLIDGLLYWDETMPSFPGTDRKQLDPDSLINANFTVFGRTDLDGDGSVWYLGSGIEAAADYKNAGMTSHPSLAVDGNNVYLVYSSVLDVPFYDAATTGLYYRGIFGVKSTDGGATFEDGISWLSYNKDCYYVDWTLFDWSNDATSWTYESIIMESENVYPSVAENIVNGKLNMIWHNDYVPETADGSIASNPTSVLFLSIDANQLGLYNNTVEIPQNMWIDYSGLSDNTLSNMSIYPNPATTTATIAISSVENAEAVVTICNLMGQIVYNENVVLNEGVNNINLAVNNFKAGVYMINVKTNKGTSTQKLIVK